MFNFKRGGPQIPFVLASLIFWGSFAWGLPAEAGGTEGEAEVTAEDPWAGVKISDAYDELRCPYCYSYNELTAARCRSCGYEFPQPSGEYTYPPWVFVPGKGYYREGTMLEPAKSKKGYWVTGIVVAAAGPIVVITSLWYESENAFYTGSFMCLVGGGIGAALIIYGLVARTEPVYAFAGGERYEPYERPAYALRSPDTDGVALRVELTALSF
jgi:hypothetical protein